MAAVYLFLLSAKTFTPRCGGDSRSAGHKDEASDEGVERSVAADIDTVECHQHGETTTTQSNSPAQNRDQAGT